MTVQNLFDCVVNENGFDFPDAWAWAKNAPLEEVRSTLDTAFIYLDSIPYGKLRDDTTILFDDLRRKLNKRYWAQAAQ